MTSLNDLMAEGWDVADLRDSFERAGLSECEDRLTRAKEGRFERLLMKFLS